ncbi:MAG: ATP-binding protein, partial [Muribaculaceae bacterium]|nr:ATP-binding protein [Muribaculaceae bacterium]
MKKCRNTVPDSVWETYSAFANTRGGIILLGVCEHKDKPVEERFEVTGVEDANKVVTDFFNQLYNTQKVNRSVLVDSDVRIVEVDGKDVIHINVPEADYRQKPIYINQKLELGTF